MYAGVYTFIAGVIVVGVGVGFWLQGMLEETHQDVHLPSRHGGSRQSRLSGHSNEEMAMTRSLVRCLCLTLAISAGAAKTFAVWPPSTSFEASSESSPASVALDKLERDERRLAGIVQDLADDEAALKKLTGH